jgi:anti-sigma regulatory factor (Ser/Thr protein kinase)
VHTVEVMIEIDVADDSAVAEARRKVAEQGKAAGFGLQRAGELALVATELSTNLIKHAGKGKLLFGAGESHVDLLALDRGAGMADVQRCLADGYSSAGTLGHGLGAVRRMTQAFHVASWPGRGTAVFARLVRDEQQADASDDIAAIDVPKAGEAVCGDAWALHRDEAVCTLFMVDGLGHGSEAALAAHAAVRQFQRSRGEAPADIVNAVHLALRHTRGGAVAVARLDRAASTVVYAGLGNIAATLAAPDGRLRRMVSLNGTAGHNARKILSFEYPCGEGLLIMHSDGIGSSWTLDPYPGFMRLHPMLLAGLLMRDHSRLRDDATVLVARTHAP